MKKLAALILAALILAATAATALAKTTYDPGKLHFIIVAADEDTGDTYATIITYKTALKRIKAGHVYELYLLESDALVPVDYTITADGVTLTNRMTGAKITQ